MRRALLSCLVVIAAASPASANDEFATLKAAFIRHCDGQPRSDFCTPQIREALESVIKTCEPTPDPDACAAERLEYAMRIQGIIERNKAAAAEEAHKRAALPNRDPGAVNLCPPPHRMTRDGCQ